MQTDDKIGRKGRLYLTKHIWVPQEPAENLNRKMSDMILRHMPKLPLGGEDAIRLFPVLAELKKSHDKIKADLQYLLSHPALTSLFANLALRWEDSQMKAAVLHEVNKPLAIEDVRDGCHCLFRSAQATSRGEQGADIAEISIHRVVYHGNEPLTREESLAAAAER